jgi:HD-GYP domain-containing protein (c-di-GMP phosphodiesterase class II)
LKGEEIPIEARILTIADAFEAMTSARPYRTALTLQRTVKLLRQGAGHQFDPKLVEAFIGIVESGLPEEVKIAQDSSSEQTDQ